LTDAGYRTQMRQIDINRPINKPSFLMAAANTAMNAARAYATGQQIQQGKTS